MSRLNYYFKFSAQKRNEHSRLWAHIKPEFNFVIHNKLDVSYFNHIWYKWRFKLTKDLLLQQMYLVSIFVSRSKRMWRWTPFNYSWLLFKIIFHHIRYNRPTLKFRSWNIYNCSINNKILEQRKDGFIFLTFMTLRTCLVAPLKIKSNLNRETCPQNIC